MAGGDDDTTPGPLFKNVPRLPRSAAASWPRNKLEPDGGDNPGGGFSIFNNNLSPPAMTSVPSNKRRRTASSTGGGGVPRAKKHRLVVPVEGAEPKDAKYRGVGRLGGIPPAPLLPHKEKAAAAAPAAASSASSTEAAEPAVDWAENERHRKGKTPVVNDEDDDAVARRCRHPPAVSGGLGKLLGDAIRSHESTAAVGGTFKTPSRTTKPKKPRTKPNNKKKTKPKPPTKKKDSSAWFWCGTGRDGMSSAGSDADYSFDSIAVVSDRLRTSLRNLGVAAPVRLYGRILTRCDRDIQQTRLLMSCKRWRADGAEFPPCAFLTEDEKAAAHGEGLPLTAYDRGGEAYELTFRFLECNVAYRLINKWGDFLRNNGLVVRKEEMAAAPADDDVMLDLWLFRPSSGGKVGMVLLHYRRGDAAHADAALVEVEQKKLHNLMMLNNGDAAAGTGGNAVVEDVVVGDANEEGDEDAGVNGEVVAAAAPAPSSSPSESESDGGGGASATKAIEEQAGAPAGEVTDAPPSTSPEMHGGAGRSDEVTAPLLSLGGDGTEEEEEEEKEAGGGALMVMVLEVEAAATQSSLDSNAGDAANGGGATKMAREEDEAAAELVEAAARSWNVTRYEFQAAQGLVKLSKARRQPRG